MIFMQFLRAVLLSATVGFVIFIIGREKKLLSVQRDGRALFHDETVQ